MLRQPRKEAAKRDDLIAKEQIKATASKALTVSGGPAARRRRRSATDEAA